jgi:hypothetical protein
MVLEQFFKCEVTQKSIMQVCPVSKCVKELVINSRYLENQLYESARHENARNSSYDVNAQAREDIKSS